MTTTQNSEISEAYSFLSDMHKDAYGFRCRTYRDDLTLEEINEEIEELSLVIKDNINQERLQEMRDEMEFKALLQRTINLGAGDEQTALKWIVTGIVEDVRDYFEIETFLYTYGIMHSEYGRTIKKRIIHMFGE